MFYQIHFVSSAVESLIGAYLMFRHQANLIGRFSGVWGDLPEDHAHPPQLMSRYRDLTARGLTFKIENVESGLAVASSGVIENTCASAFSISEII
jgi:hypothetical protein